MCGNFFSYSIILQKIKLSSQTIAIIGLLLTFSSCVLMADWQAIPYDECTEYSPFHHPELAGKLFQPSRYLKRRSTCRSSHFIAESLQDFKLNFQTKLALTIGSVREIPLSSNNQFSCHPSDVCNKMCGRRSIYTICLQYYMYLDQHGCLEHMDSVSPHDNRLSVRRHSSLLCSNMISSFSFCVVIDEVAQAQNSSHAVIQSLQRLDTTVYETAMENCLLANTSNGDCYWNPYSYITKKLCEDCQPICRSRSHSLTFAQFVLGSALLLVSIPVAWVPVAALISNRVSTAAQVLTIKIASFTIINFLEIYREL